MSLQITLDIPTERLADLFTSALESGDPVTTASKGGWCWGIYWQSRMSPDSALPDTGRDPWYAAVSLYERDDFQIEIVEVADESAFRWYYDNGKPCDAIFGAGADRDVTREKNLKSGAFTSHTVSRENIVSALQQMAIKMPGAFGDILRNDMDATTADLFLQFCLFGEERYG